LEEAHHTNSNFIFWSEVGSNVETNPFIIQGSNKTTGMSGKRQARRWGGVREWGDMRLTGHLEVNYNVFTSGRFVFLPGRIEGGP